MAVASSEMRAILAANSTKARNDRDPEAALLIPINGAEKRGNDIAENNDDHDREAVLALMLCSASTLVGVVLQGQGGRGHKLLSVIAFAVSLFGYLGHKYFSRVRISAARACSGVALFSASLSLASLLAMPLHGKILRCIPYAICIFPLLSLLWSFYSCLKASHDDRPTPDSPSASLSSPTASSGSIVMAAATARSSNLPIRNATTGDIEMALLPPTAVAVVANATAPRDEEEASVAEDDGRQVGYYDCFVS